jgi:hypothetical protein
VSGGFPLLLLVLLLVALLLLLLDDGSEVPPSSLPRPHWDAQEAASATRTTGAHTRLFMRHLDTN